jgi:5,10-methylenetetrahydrofolate reductase
METIIEIQTPLPHQLEAFLDRVSSFSHIDSVLLSEEDGISSVVVAEILQKKCSRQPLLKITCSNRNRIAIYSELVTAAFLGFSSFVLADGAHPLTTKFPSAKPVYDLDALNLLRLLKDDSMPFPTDAPPLRGMAQWKIGVCIGGSTKPDLIRAERFVSAGADFIFARSSESIHQLKSLIKKAVILSVPRPRADDFSLALQQAKAAGADGVNIIFEDFGEKRAE